MTLGGNGSIAVTVDSVHIGNVSTLFALERGQLLNRLNVIHFQDGCLCVVLGHKDHDHTIRLRATPHPVADEHIKAILYKDAILPHSLSAFTQVPNLGPATVRPGYFRIDLGSIQRCLFVGINWSAPGKTFAASSVNFGVKYQGPLKKRRDQPGMAFLKKAHRFRCSKEDQAKQRPEVAEKRSYWANPIDQLDFARG